MRKIFLVPLFLLLFSLGAAAQTVPISASTVTDSFGHAIPLARLCFAPVTAALTPQGFRVGTNQVVPNEACGTVTSGVLQSGLGVEPSPSGVFYHVYVKGYTANTVLRDFGLVSITGSSWTLDTFDPSTVTVPASALTMGTVTTLAPGTGGSCTLSNGTSGAVLLNCSIPQGATGPTGPPGSGGTPTLSAVAGLFSGCNTSTPNLGFDGVCRATGADATKLPLAGGTLTGPLLLAADPSAALGAATKQYVDAHVGGALPTGVAALGSNGLSIAGNASIGTLEQYVTCGNTSADGTTIAGLFNTYTSNLHVHLIGTCLDTNAIINIGSNSTLDGGGMGLH